MTDLYDYSSDEEVTEFRRRNEAARRMRERARKQLFDETSGNDETNDRAVKLVQEASSRVTEEYSNAMAKSKEQDRKIMDYIDQLLDKATLSYGTSRRRGTVPSLVPLQRNGFRRTVHYAPVELNGQETNGLRNDKKMWHGENLEDTRSSDTARERVRRIEEHLDGILDYELPSVANFRAMRQSLRDINDKMSTHKTLLNRGGSYGLEDDNRKVSERIDQKYRELEERMPELLTGERDRTRQRSAAFDPSLIPGYATGLSIMDSNQTAELRGRIRTLLCRTRRTAESADRHTKTARHRREAETN
ncbi:unnamed protein product [Dicrocoelium dendriticum]|nr:unnamed protein product [Dicrocoelium dendriticum]